MNTAPLTFIDGYPNAKILTEDDLAEVKCSGKMFCRKMVSKYSDGLRSLIDAERED